MRNTLTRPAMQRSAALAWACLLLYPLTQLVVATAWQAPAYDWRANYISSLGNTACGMSGGLYVCSPLHPLMNGMFIVTGLLMLFGGLAFAARYATSRLAVTGFVLQALSGAGAILVGLVPENAGSPLHGLGALLPFLGGNLGLILLAAARTGWPRWLRGYSLLSGLIGVTALILFVTGTHLGLGTGGIERVVDGVHVGWMIVFGLMALFIPRRLTR